MSQLAYQILALFMQIAHREDYARGYLATWTLRELLGCEQTIEAVRIKIYPETPEEKAMRELVDLGILEEMPDLGERFHLVVK